MKEFDSEKIVFNKDTYETRIHSEADLMIALEAYKNEVRGLNDAFDELKKKTYQSQASISSVYFEMEESSEQNVANKLTLDANGAKIHSLMDTCRYKDQVIRENRAALTLYCQQFAFGSEMPYACSHLLDCRDR